MLWCRTLTDWVASVPASYWTFNPLGEPARRCLVFAQFEAGSSLDSEVSVNHLLLGILRQYPALVPAAVRDTMVRAIAADEPRGRWAPAGARQYKLGAEVIGVVRAANDIAHAAGRQKVTPADLATAIRFESDSLAARLLRAHGPNPLSA